MGVFRIPMGVFSLINIGLTEILTIYDVEGFNLIAIAFGVLVILTWWSFWGGRQNLKVYLFLKPC